MAFALAYFAFVLLFLLRFFRSIAETFYQLGVAQAFGAKYPEAESSLNSAIGVLEARVKNLGAMEASDNIAQEIQDLEALVKDIKDKIVDHKDMEKGVYVDEEAAGFTGDSRFLSWS